MLNEKILDYSPKRLLILDWASISYQQMFAMVSKKNKTAHTFQSSEEEMFMFRQKMYSKVLSYIKFFNPLDIIITKESKKTWRHEFVKEYYNNHAKVYYNDKSFYLRFDCYLYRFTKDSDGNVITDKLHPYKDAAEIPEKMKLLKDMPIHIQDMMWEDCLPAYKGKRKDRTWDFITPFKDWSEAKEAYADEVAPLFRANCIGNDMAEGDDVVYAAVNHLSDKYESIVLISRDSDFNQLLDNPKLHRFDNIKEELVQCISAKDYLDIKILAGDTSDNINGIALPEKATRLTEAGATKLFESVDNVYEVAKKQEWDNQFLRNQRLIDLSKVPKEIYNSITSKIEEWNHELCEYEQFMQFELTDYLRNETLAMKDIGFFVLNNRDNILATPERYTPERYIREMRNTVDKTIAVHREFEMEDVFNGYTVDEDAEFISDYKKLHSNEGLL